MAESDGAEEHLYNVGHGSVSGLELPFATHAVVELYKIFSIQ